jgi:hypothetical protein
VPAARPAGSVSAALAVPLLTAADTVRPATVNSTVPLLTVVPAAVTWAVRVSVWAALLNVRAGGAARVMVVWPITVVVAVELLVAVLAWNVVVVALAVSLRLVPPATPVPAVAMTWKTSVVPVGRLAMVKLAVLPVLVLVNVSGPLVCLSETRVKPAGNASVSVTVAAAEGPRLVSVMVNVALPPAVTVAGPVLLTDRSAAVTVVVSVLELPLPPELVKLAALGRVVLPVSVEPAVAMTRKTSVLPAAIEVAVKDTMLPVLLLVNVSVPLTWLSEVSVSPVGSASLRATVLMALVPPLVKVRL